MPVFDHSTILMIVKPVGRPYWGQSGLLHATNRPPAPTHTHNFPRIDCLGEWVRTSIGHKYCKITVRATWRPACPKYIWGACSGQRTVSAPLHCINISLSPLSNIHPIRWCAYAEKLASIHPNYVRWGRKTSNCFNNRSSHLSQCEHNQLQETVKHVDTILTQQNGVVF